MAEPENAAFKTLLDDLAAGDQDAAAAIFGNLFDRVAAVVRPRIGARYAAKVSPESVANSACKSLYRGIAGGAFEIPNEAALFSLVSKIAIAKVLNRIRDSGRQKRSVDREQWAELAHQPAAQPYPGFDVEVRDLLEVHTRDLSDVEREVIHLSVIGTPVQETAEATGLSTRTVIRVRTRFAKQLGAADPPGAAG